MQKNKIDVVKAVCNSAARKLAVLSLAVAVSGGAVASAQAPQDRQPIFDALDKQLELNTALINDLLSEITSNLKILNDLDQLLKEKAQQVEEAKNKVRARLEKGTEANCRATEFSQNFEAAMQQAATASRLAEESQTDNEEMGYLFEAVDTAAHFLADYGELVDVSAKLECEINNVQCAEQEMMLLTDEYGRLCDEYERLAERINSDYKLVESLRNESNMLLERLTEEEKAIRRSVELQGEDSQNKDKAETTTSTTMQDVVRNVTTLPNQILQPQQNQQQQYVGGMFNPFNWGFFGGKK